MSAAKKTAYVYNLGRSFEAKTEKGVERHVIRNKLARRLLRKRHRPSRIEQQLRDVRKDMLDLQEQEGKRGRAFRRILEKYRAEAHAERRGLPHAA